MYVGACVYVHASTTTHVKVQSTPHTYLSHQCEAITCVCIPSYNTEWYTSLEAHSGLFHWVNYLGGLLDSRQ